MKEPIHVSEANFDRAVLQAPVPVLVDFWAPWCGPCKMISPVLDEIAREHEDKALVAKVNVDDDPALAARFGVRGIPALFYFQNGAVKDQLVGAASKQAIASKLQALIGSE
jgi:thioredoxin 1